MGCVRDAVRVRDDVVARSRDVHHTHAHHMRPRDIKLTSIWSKHTVPVENPHPSHMCDAFRKLKR